ncbi:hypothetical protein BD324DRAFT_651816 [Kockovaella imperatae]|uniref:Uncharacterized protein n=1 Tax=Kockovaella imperatae TaxID=4999 RepID=A0A1Y1UD16_9TREE|nr:hypothetical protein BD324DRAFT_651816 [Kockovaella imperatae]ORX35902.1 hypothetical protein BD324DRAFT_651816 [Kockovaella imperatae]
MSLHLRLLSVFYLLAASVHALPAATRSHTDPASRSSNPSFSASSLAAISLDPNYQRDSCVSATKLFGDRVFWVCRDTIVLTDQSLNDEFANPGVTSGFVSSTGSWSNQTSGGAAGPLLVPPPSGQGQQQATSSYQYQLTQYGGDIATTAYVPYADDECNSDGNQAGTGAPCSNNGTRVPLWPDSPPYVTQVASDGSVTAWLYLRRPLIKGLSIQNFEPPGSLYYIYWPSNDGADTLPLIGLVNEEFFPEGSFTYGDYGGVVDTAGEYLYLFGQSLYTDSQGNQPIALARCPVDSPANNRTYEYYYNDGTWSSVQPSVNDTSAFISAGAGGQGTYFYSSYLGQYVWLGQLANSLGLQVAVSVAPEPYGPWSAPSVIAILPASEYGPTYSVAAHPEMSSNQQEIYLTYTRQVYWNNNADNSDRTFYENPLWHMTWN